MDSMVKWLTLMLLFPSLICMSLIFLIIILVATYLSSFFENLHAIRKEYEKKGEPEYMINAMANGMWYYDVQGLSFVAKGLGMEFESLLTSWMVIDFLNNKLLGEIPETLGELHSLIVLNLSHNSLTGPIPSSLGDLLELESLDLSSNMFQGRIPMELRNLGFLVKIPAKFDGDDDELNWRFSILMGYGCGLVLGVSLGYI
ncbi:hypothetical protein Godav_028461, partial [Gossypium davidsonii]|nr:hypothetical protein [Gossypium davidsonii]